MRSLTTAVDAALQSAGLCLVLLVELYYDAATVYLNNTSKTIPWGGNNYLGAAQVGKIDPVEDSATLQSRGISMTLTGIPPANIAEALTDYYQGRTVILRAAILDANHQVVADPVITFRGRIDTQKITVGSSCTITLTAGNRLADWDRARLGVFNDQDQRQRSPTDAFFEFVADMVDQPLNWGILGGSAPPLVTSGGFALNQTTQ